MDNENIPFYVIYNSYGDWAYVDNVPTENEESGFEIVSTLINGEEIE